jgi:16S rRNA C1402 (ribose-2'-O) methylase RsmI
VSSQSSVRASTSQTYRPAPRLRADPRRTRRLLKGSTIEIRFVSVSGHQARVESRYKFADAGAEPRTVLLLSEDGDWRVSDPG